MKNTTKRVLAFAGVLALGLGAVKAQTDGALLDALVKKGVLSDQEAEDIRASAAQEYSKTPAGKLGISDYVQKLTLYGDARFRFEYIDDKPQVGTGTSGDNIVERNRYRIRVGADYTFTDNFKAGVELESALGNDTANQTFGDEYGKASINVGLIFLQWKPVDLLTITGGKQRNPIYSTDLMWDPDINPEGGSEVASWTFPIDFGSDAPASNDPKAIAAPHDPSTMSLTVGLTAFQGIYSDNQEFAAPGTDNTDVWQFVEQVPVQFNFNKDTFIKVVPGFDTYTGGGNSSSSFPAASTNVSAANGSGTVNFTSPQAANDLAIVTAPGEVDWKLWDQPMKAYWDFAWNTEGKARVQNVYFGNRGGAFGTTITTTQQQNQSLGDNVAWLAGLQVGQNKKKGDWMIKADYRQVGLGAVDPNLNDSDWGDSFLNQQGIKVSSSYNFTDFLIGTVSYYDSWDYKTNLLNGSGPGSIPTGLPLAGGGGAAVAGGTAATPGTSLAGNLVGASTVQRVQVDLLWKF